MLNRYLSASLRFGLRIIIGFICISVPAQAQSPQNEKESNWKTHAPGGETRCALGDEYKYYTRNGDSEKLLIHFTGGGSCWSGAMCDPRSGRSTNYNYIPSNRHPGNMDGIFNLQNEDNPFQDFTMLVAPTCTGDVALGDSVVTYTYRNKESGSMDITVFHKGYANSLATLEWAYKNKPKPEIVVVSGSSAGGVSAPFYANLVAGHFKDARVVGISDAAGHLDRQTLNGKLFNSWNLQSTLSNHAGFRELDPAEMGVPTLFNTAVNDSVPNLELYQVNQAYDMAGRFYLGRMGIRDVDLLDLIKKNDQKIKEHNSEYRSFIIGGEEHRLLQESRFYFFTSRDMPLKSWIQDILAGNRIQSIHCTNCNRPGMKYSDADLKILSVMNDMLAEEQDWKSSDNFRKNRNCQESSDTYSLRCTLWLAIGKVGGSPDEYPVTFAFKYAAKEKIGDELNYRSPILNQYNNLEETTYRDIVRLIKEVESEVKSELGN